MPAGAKVPDSTAIVLYHFNDVWRGVLLKIGGDVIQTRKRTSQPFANCDMIGTVVKYWEVDMIAIVSS